MGVFNSFKANVLSPNSVDFIADTIKVALMASSYVPDIDTQEFFADVSGDEASGAGYTAGGQALTTKSVTQDNTNNLGIFDADDTQWPNSTISARYALIYKDTGNPATSPIIGYIDFLVTRSSNGGTYSLQWQTLGIVNAS